MADINNLNTGDQASLNSQYTVNNSKLNVVKTEGGTSAEYAHNWRRAPRPFGLNVRVPQNHIGVRTQNLIKKTIVDVLTAPAKEVVNYFKKNEDVFNGNVSAQIESLQKQQKLTVELLQDEDEVVMSDVPSFMMDM